MFCHLVMTWIYQRLAAFWGLSIVANLAIVRIAVRSSDGKTVTGCGDMRDCWNGQKH